MEKSKCTCEDRNTDYHLKVCCVAVPEKKSTYEHREIKIGNSYHKETDARYNAGFNDAIDAIENLQRAGISPIQRLRGVERKSNHDDRLCQLSGQANVINPPSVAVPETIEIPEFLDQGAPLNGAEHTTGFIRETRTKLNETLSYVKNLSDYVTQLNCQLQDLEQRLSAVERDGR